MRKIDIVWLGTHYCKHGHTYIEHYQCFLVDKPNTCPFVEKVGYFDIESTGFNADFCYTTSYAILGDDTKIIGRVLTPYEIKHGIFDKKLVEEICKDLFKFNRIVVHYGSDRKFDIPFVRSRALKFGYEFPLYKDIWVTDTWNISFTKLKLRNNRLKTICEFFGIEAKTHPLNPDIWLKSSIGDKEALQYIWEHNVEDVESLKAVYKLLEPYVLKGQRSI
jgi:uncharacterized protein YprB with RNaseH-like and TPR domain